MCNRSSYRRIGAEESTLKFIPECIQVANLCLERPASVDVGDRTFKLPSSTTSEYGRHDKSLGDPVTDPYEEQLQDAR